MYWWRRKSNAVIIAVIIAAIDARFRVLAEARILIGRFQSVIGWKTHSGYRV